MGQFIYWFEIFYLHGSLASYFSIQVGRSWSCMSEIAAWRRCKYGRSVNWLSLKGTLTIPTNTCLETWSRPCWIKTSFIFAKFCVVLRWNAMTGGSVCSALLIEHIHSPMAEYPVKFTLDHTLTVTGCWQCGPGVRQRPVALRSVVSISICFYTVVSMCPRIFWQGISANNKSPSLQQETSECWCAEITVYQRQLPSVRHAIVTVAPMHNVTHGTPLKPGLRASLK